PQLVALFNGVGGGTVALIAWSEFIETKGFSEFKPDQSPTVALVVGSLFAAIIGSVSFWGSLVAFAKLQESIPKNVEKRLVASAKLFQASNIVLLLAAVGTAVYIGLHPGLPVWWIVAVLVFAGVMGLFVVFPIGGADMPVVISLLNAMTGLSAAAAGLALNNTAMIVAGMIVGASGSILTNLMAVAMIRSIPAIVFGSFGGSDAGAAGG
ncbi:NAD(P)(+) transhydrogenase (Re/Si-specific) subunit beta, partial [Staphylococcus capitis]|nr:NAD(P)(+) transhydrogenase (Re/Si-specific) subunit beta [Staphylococcus capitis]